MSNKLYSVAIVLSLSIPSIVYSSNAREVFEYHADGQKKSCVITKTNCIKADFDGNGLPDYSVPHGEGFILVIMNRGSTSEKTLEIDAGGVAEVYEARSSVGKHGEPVSMNQAILIKWVGKEHHVYKWNGDNFTKTSFPGFYEKQ